MVIAAFIDSDGKMYIDEIDKKDVALVGGKGANLGEMTKAGFQVPYGFCVTTANYFAVRSSATAEVLHRCVHYRTHYLKTIYFMHTCPLIMWKL